MIDVMMRHKHLLIVPGLLLVLASLAWTTPSTVRKEPNGWLNVRLFGAKGDGVADDTEAIQAAISSALEDLGGTVFLPAGTYLVTQPIALESGVSLVGASQRSTVVKKTNDTSNTDGFDCVFYARTKFGWHIQGVTVIGNRTRNPADGAITVSSDGILAYGCSYFFLQDVRVQECQYGFNLRQCWCASIENACALRCQSYGFYAWNSCTSLTFKTCTAWATGGAFKLWGCLYSTIISPAYDYGDAGGHPEDPFLSADGTMSSGGNYQSPGCVFHLASSTVTIVSPGTENGYSRYMYCEGSDVVVTNPTVNRVECHASPWRFIELRGTATSSVEILNPRFILVVNKLEPASNRCGLYVENATKQRLTFNRHFEFDPSFGPYGCSSAGVYVSSREAFPISIPAAVEDGDTAITAANLQAKILTMASSTTGRAPTVPTGTAVNAVILIGESLDWSFINTGDQTVTITAAEGHTLVGGMAIAAGTQKSFRTRCSAANTAVTYALS